MLIDCLQYCNWSRAIFEDMRAGGVDCVHVTVSYWEDFRATAARIADWHRRFERHADLITHARTAADVRRAASEGRTAIIFGFQNCSPIDDDFGFVQVLHELGGRFMQLTYNNQSPLATGCYETEDAGVTRFGRQVIAEMNRVGMVVDMSHSAERSTLEAIAISTRPIAISHANSAVWEPALRNKSDTVLEALAESGGMLGFSLYPHHLKGKCDCRIEDFCAMVARTAEIMGTERIGIGSDLVQGHPDSVAHWMRNGRWSRDTDYGEGDESRAGWPAQPEWFKSNRDFGAIARGLAEVGFAADEVARIMGENWLDFFEASFGPAP